MLLGCFRLWDCAKWHQMALYGYDDTSWLLDDSTFDHTTQGGASQLLDSVKLQATVAETLLACSKVQLGQDL